MEIPCFYILKGYTKYAKLLKNVIDVDNSEKIETET